MTASDLDFLPTHFPFYAEQLDSARAHVLKGKTPSLLVMRKGRVHCHGKNPVSLSRPSIAFLPSSSGISVNPGSQIFRFLFLNTFLLSGATELHQEGSETLFTSDRMGYAEIESASLDRVLTVAETILQEFRTREQGYRNMIRLSFQELLVFMRRLGIQGNQSSSGSGSWSIDEVMEYLKNHYSENHSLATLAEKCGYSPAYFSRMFHEQTRIPLFEYINRLRIDKACLYLKRSDLPITEIAFAVGYNNVSFFNRYFRKLTNTSPRNYRLSGKG